jgi:hypothetical protein
MESLNDNFD